VVTERPEPAPSPDAKLRGRARDAQFTGDAVAGAAFERRGAPCGDLDLGLVCARGARAGAMRGSSVAGRIGGGLDLWSAFARN
jgi:hypothetical protein